jgi:hypothetical protein
MRLSHPECPPRLASGASIERLLNGIIEIWIRIAAVINSLP